MSDQKGFFGSLFDMSFSEFITTKIIKFLYVLSIIFIGLGALALIIFGFIASVWIGLLVLFIVAPIYIILYIIIVRVWLELMIVIFRIAENTGQLIEQNKQKLTPGSPTDNS
jgi:hypothetical protein